METVFLICFLSGLLFTLVSFFVGDVLDGVIGGGEIPFLSPTIIASFITVFGGAGLFISKSFTFGLFLTLSISSGLAIIAALLMLFLVVLPLKKGEVSAAKSQDEMIGKVAEIITPFSGDEKGEVIYEQGGSRLSSPAVSIDGLKLNQGEEVEIVDVENGTFRVRKRKGEK